MAVEPDCSGKTLFPFVATDLEHHDFPHILMLTRSGSTATGHLSRALFPKSRQDLLGRFMG